MLHCHIYPQLLPSFWAVFPFKPARLFVNVFGLKGKSHQWHLKCLYENMKTEIQMWVLDVHLYAFFFVCQFRAKE